MTYHLYTTHYWEPNQERRAELEECLRRNLTSGLFSAVCVLCEGERPNIPLSWMETECQLKKQPNRQTFSDLFAWGRENADENTVSIFANSDIFFDDSLLLVETQDMDGKCWALSRWNQDATGNSAHWVAIDSQDAWIFKGPIRAVNADYAPGIPGTDNRLAYELNTAGYEVLNPSKSVRAHHLHNSAVRNYTQQTEKVPGPYLLIEPTYLEIS